LFVVAFIFQKEKIMKLKMLLVILALSVVAFIFQKADSLAITTLAIIKSFK
jgi:EamA domain-containing membrane protein RarD